MAQRNHPEDQRADTLTYHLTILTQAISPWQWRIWRRSCRNLPRMHASAG
jgi:hypothetical protein